MTPISRQLLDTIAIHDVVLGERLRACGVSPDAIRHAVAKERLFRHHRGVYALTPSLTAKGRWFAAVAACGRLAALSHLSAAALWNVSDLHDHVVEVTVPRSGGRRDPRGIRVHRTIRPQSTRRDRIEVTTLHRTIDDCAYRLSRRQLHRMLRQAEYHHRLDVHALAATATSRSLKVLLTTYVAGEGVDKNELEARFFALCAAACFPLPAGQVWHGTGRVDFSWPELRLVAELDGRAAHERTLAFQDDRARDRALKLAGLEVLRFNWSEVVATPDVVIADLRAFLSQDVVRSRH